MSADLMDRLERSADSFSLKNSASYGENWSTWALFSDPIQIEPAKLSLAGVIFIFFPLLLGSEVRTAQDAHVIP